MFSWMRSQAEPTRPILDHSYLARLSQFIGETETWELLADGMLELTERLARARHLAAAEDAAELSRLLHDITGTAGHLGLSALSSEAAIGQRALAQDAKCIDVLDPLLALEDPSMSALKAYCRDEQAGSADDPE